MIALPSLFCVLFAQWLIETARDRAEARQAVLLRIDALRDGLARR